ncbi:MAG: glycosyltransferase family 2 protein [Planctomycetota bacterium]|jgi:rhamnosyltransferase
MKVSLFIPTLNGAPLLAEVLQAIDLQEGVELSEKLAIDSGSSDGTVELLKKHDFEVRSIDKRDFNHGATRDQGIAAVTGDVVVLLTQDAQPADEHWLQRLVDCYQDPSVAAAYCRQIPRENCNPFIAARLREWNAGRSVRSVQKLDEPDSLAKLEPMQRLQLCAFDNVASSLRRADWESHKFGHCSFGEDVSLGKDLILAGRSIVFEPDSAVVHSHNRSPREEGKRIYCDHQNLRRLFDLRLIPSYSAWKESLRNERVRHAATVAALDLPEDEKKSLHAWARSYAFWSTLGMYLGANSESKMQEKLGPLFRMLDRRMHRGI